MRFSTISLLSLAAAAPVLGQNNGTYLKTHAGKYLGYTMVSRGIMIGLAVDGQSKASKASINSKGNLEIEIEGGESKAGMSLSDISGGPGNLSEVLIGYETPTKGFTFDQNGGLTLDEERFHGFFACREGGEEGQMYWATEETKTPDGCEKLSFAKVA
ncbi:uncharacterized protein TRUGW13939_11922 [Talaromyces rugulosus]|uniref:DUF7907 domain-containing protein n=1 Tax=Talaromyces rugulosus TaxID=121627 RepID=A0A7H8REQ1_TALRU|nr:uncharacterized protein TRUGW13939_11922 [Talaromyces rugulosus]QKX64746.1 hypothetical protein TRUGW13939_11922 [Talaromyces rugulosus]